MGKIAPYLYMQVAKLYFLAKLEGIPFGPPLLTRNCSRSLNKLKLRSDKLGTILFGKVMIHSSFGQTIDCEYRCGVVTLSLGSVRSQVDEVQSLSVVCKSRPNDKFLGPVMDL